MTQKKLLTDIDVYTKNATYFLDRDFYDAYLLEIQKVLDLYFDQHIDMVEIQYQVIHALRIYHMWLQVNPNRKITQKQKNDRLALISSLHETCLRLHPIHIPLPLLHSVQESYQQNDDYPTLQHLLADVTGKLKQLKSLFESVEISTPKITNPGKPERDSLVNTLASLFDEYAPASLADSDHEYKRHRRLFIQDICNATDFKITFPRYL